MESSGVAGSISALNQQGRIDGEGKQQSSPVPGEGGWGRSSLSSFFPESVFPESEWGDDLLDGRLMRGLSPSSVIEDGATMTVHVCLADASGQPDLATVQTRTAVSGTLTLAALCLQELKAAGRQGTGAQPTTSLAPSARPPPSRALATTRSATASEKRPMEKEVGAVCHGRSWLHRGLTQGRNLHSVSHMELSPHLRPHPSSACHSRISHGSLR